MTDCYDPLIASLEFPVQVLTARCRAQAPLHFPPSPGSTPGTTLSGAFGNALWDCACVLKQSGPAACKTTKDTQCRQPQRCPLPWLYKPYSPVHRRSLTRPVLFRAPDLEQGTPVSVFSLTVILWGRHAIAARDSVEHTLRTMGAVGLSLPHGTRVPFAITTLAAEPPQTLAERTAALTGVPWQRALLMFETPCLHRETVTVAEDRREKLFLAGGELPLNTLLGNCAYELAAWDMEDRAPGLSLDRQTRHDLAREARETVRSLAESLYITHCDLHPVALGSRYSKTNGRQYPLTGFIGQAQLAGPIEPVLPWLLALALGGGGQKRAMGFGSVRLWLEP